MLSAASVPFTQGELAALHAEEVSWEGQTGYAFDGEFIARFANVSGKRDDQVVTAQSRVDATRSARLFSRTAGGKVRVIRQLGADGVYLVEAPDRASIAQVYGALKDVAGFLSVEPNSLAWIADRTPNDTNYSQQYALTRTQVPAAWDVTTGGLSDLVVGVVDTGVDYTHPDLAANMWRNPGEIPGDGIDNDGNGYVDDYHGFNFAGVRTSNPFDDNRHGTHVAGIIAAQGNNNRGIAGVNWSAKIMAIKFLNSSGSGALSDAVEAINYQAMMVERGVPALISNHSWRTTTFDTALQNAVNRYAAAGGLLVAAAGNDSTTSPVYPGGFTTPSILTVANTDQNDALASDSNRGTSWVDLAAPGTAILSTTPNNTYTSLSGTSMSAPMVAGAAALLWDVAGLSTPRDTIRNAIMNGVDVIGTLSGAVATSGRLNVFRSLGLLDLSWSVRATTPAANTVVTEALTQFDVDFTAPVRESSIAGSDFTVNGTPADGATLVDADTVRFTFTNSPLQVSGVQTMAIAANAILRASDGRGVNAFTADFSYDAVRLAVTSATPAPGSSVVVPLTSVELNWNEPIDPSSVLVNDLVTTRGTVTGVSVVDQDTVRWTVSGLTEESVAGVVFSVAPNAVRDAAGFGSDGFSMALSLDSAPRPLTNLFVPIGIPGGQVWRLSSPLNGVISTGGDVDEFPVSLDALSRLTVSVDAGPGLHPAIDIRDPSGLVVATSNPDRQGQDAIIQGFSVSAAGTYTIAVRGLLGTADRFTLSAQINALDEQGLHDLAPGSTQATAQPIDNSVVNYGSRSARYAVTGVATPASTTDTIVAFTNPLDTVLPAGWSTYVGSSQGRVRVTTQFGGYLSPGALVMDRATSGDFTLTEAVYTVNLTGLANPRLRFAHADLGDEEDPIPASWAGRTPGDGVSFSVDGTNWFRLWTPSDAPVGQWNVFEFNLAAAAQAAGVTLGSAVRIKFQQYDNQPAPLDGRAFDAVDILADQPSVDWYSFPRSATEAFSLSLRPDSPTTGLQLDLYNGPTLVASGVPNGSSGEIVIDSVIAPEAKNALTVRVSGGSINQPVGYTLAVSRGAGLDFEPNDLLANAQPVVQPVVFGRAGDASDPGDGYQFVAAAGNVLSIVTTTPYDGPLAPSNSLDPQVQILGPTGSVVATLTGGAADARNVLGTYTVTTPGIYTVRVTAQSGVGDYTLAVSGNTGGAVPFRITAVTPANNAVVATQVNEILLDVSHTPLSTSLAPTDLTINGVPAASATIIDRDTIRFTTAAPLTDGVYTLSVSAGAISSASGQPIAAFTSSFRVDLQPPRVVQSSISQGGFVATGALTYTATFSEALRAGNLDPSDVLLERVGTSETYAAQSVSYDTGTNRVSVDFANLPEATFRLTLKSADGAFEDIAGLDLDGEATWPLPAAGSGNGVPGGDFVVQFSTEIVNVGFPVPLSRVAPAGSLVYTGQTSSKIDFDGDVDAFTVNLDAGQQISLLLSSTGSALQPQVRLVAPDGSVVATQAGPAGGRALIQSAPVTTAGVYRIEASGAASTIGAYALAAWLNAGIEREGVVASVGNDTPATAQSLDSAALQLGIGSSRAVVTGEVAASTGVDWYSFTATAGETTSVFLSGVPGQVVELYDSAAQLVTVGTNNTGEIVSQINRFVASTSGTFYLRVTGAAGLYRLVVTRNAAFDAEPNNSVAAGRDLGAAGFGFGFASGADVDVYNFIARTGDSLAISTRTPFDGAGEPSSLLDPRIELLDPSGAVVASNDNGAPDGRNASLSLNVVTPGVYSVRLSAVGSTSGEYTLRVAGYSGGNLPLVVVSTTPAPNAVVPSVPGAIVVDFSDSLQQSTVAAGDLLVDGVPATGVTFIDADTVSFTPPAGLAEGVRTLTIAAGNVTSLSGVSNSAYSSQFRIDLTAPRVVASSITQGQFLGVGAFTYTARFDEPLRAGQIDAPDVLLTATTLGQSFAPASLSYDTVTNVLTVTYANLPESAYRLTLKSGDGAFEDIAGLDLDGEPVWPLPAIGSGNGVAGGDFFVDFGLETITATFASPLVALNPFGSLMYRGTQSGKIDFAADVDAYQISLEAGQTATVTMTAATSVAAAITLKGPTGTVLGTAAANASGIALLQTIPIATTGVYTIEFSGAGVGAFTSQLTLNAAVEAEEIGGATNNTSGTAQSLAGAFTSIVGATTRAAVRGSASSAAVERFAVFSDSFETQFPSNNGFGPAWQIIPGGTTGRIQRTTAFGAGDGTTAMTMDVNPGGAFVRNEAIWTVNLSGLNQPRLRFAHRNVGDEPNALPSNFIGSVDGDGVAISVDGITWYTVATSNTLTNTAWANFEVDLASVAAANGLTLGNNFRVKFQQYDNLSLPSDGRAWDNVQITAAGTSDFYAVPLAAGQNISAAIRGSGTGAFDLRVFDPTGANVLATGEAISGGDVSTLLDRFVAPAAGTYYVRVAASLSAAEDYGLVVVRGGTFAPDSSSRPLTVAAGDVVLGSILGQTDVADEYPIAAAAAGTTITFSTKTIGDGAGSFDNAFDPLIEIVDASNGSVIVSNDNGAADGRNAVLGFAVPATGSFIVRVSASMLATGAATRGEYALRVTPGTPADITSSGFGSVPIRPNGSNAATIGRDVLDRKPDLRADGLPPASVLN
jgi:methionine-rich copper-binding protein CopC